MEVDLKSRFQRTLGSMAGRCAATGKSLMSLRTRNYLIYLAILGVGLNLAILLT